jgi:hypothetical protein
MAGRPDRPEDLFAGDAHIVRDITKDRGLDVEPAVETLRPATPEPNVVVRTAVQSEAVRTDVAR